MSSSLPNLEEQYTRALASSLAGEGEAALKRAYELGRQAIDSRLGMLDMALVHHAALAEALGRMVTPAESMEAAKQAGVFFAESLASFEMTQRGFQEAIIRLHQLNETLEQRVADQTQQLREAHQTLQTIIQASPVAIIALDLEGRVRLWNPAAERIFDWREAEVLGAAYPLVPANQQKDYADRLQAVLRGESFTNAEVTRQKRDGSRIVINLSAAPLYDADGAVSGAIYVLVDITARKQAENAERLLAGAGQLLAASLDYSVTLTSVARLVVPQLADWCTVDILGEDGILHPLAVVHTDPQKTQWALELQQRYPPDPNAATGAPNVVRTGRSEIYPEISDAMLEASVSDAEMLKLLREVGLKSVMVVPLPARGRTLGAITFIWAESGQHYGPNDLNLAEELARRAALAVDNARLYREAQALNAELEQRVMKRTAELQATNTRLEKEIAERKQAEAEIQRQAARAQVLVQSAARLNAQVDLAGVIHAVCETTTQALKGPIASLSLCDLKRQKLYYAGGVGLPVEYERAMQPLPLATYEAYVHQNGPLVIVPDVQALTDLPNAELYAHLNLRTTVNLSMLREGQLLGRLNIGTVGEVRHFTEAELTLLQGLTDQAAQAITNAYLYEAVQKELAVRRQTEEELRQSREQLRALSAHLQSVREEERTRIAREIHDELGQAMTGLKIDIAWLQNNLSTDRAILLDKMKTMSRLTDATVQSVRRISAELRPGVLDDLGLEAAIEWQLQEFQQRTGIQCELLSEWANTSLEVDSTTAVFRIFQETLTNVARHAHATRVTVILKEEAGQILLQVEDNGQGIAPDKITNPKSLGLIGMRERVRLRGGEFQIVGKPDEGTTISVRIPLSQGEADEERQINNP